MFVLFTQIENESSLRLKHENETLREDMEQLVTENVHLVKENKQLQEDNRTLEERVRCLEKENKRLYKEHKDALGKVVAGSVWLCTITLGCSALLTLLFLFQNFPPGFLQQKKLWKP